MEVSQYDVCDLGRLHTEGIQVLHEPPRPCWVAIGAYSGIDQCETVTAPHKESTHFDGQHALFVQELRVLEPVLIGLVEHERRGCLETPV